jgi:hypothetical protein
LVLPQWDLAAWSMRMFWIAHQSRLWAWPLSS